MKKRVLTIFSILPIVTIPLLIVSCLEPVSAKPKYTNCSTSTHDLYLHQEAKISAANLPEVDKTTIRDTAISQAGSFITVTSWTKDVLFIRYDKKVVTTATVITFNITDYFETQITLHTTEEKKVFSNANTYIDTYSFSILGTTAGASNKITNATSEVTLNPQTQSSWINPKNFSYVAGTGWLIHWLGGSKYYLLTNWHVAISLNQSNIKNLSYNFGANLNVSSHIKFASFKQKDYGKLASWPVNFGTDSYVYEVDFGNNLSTKVSEKLNTINAGHSANEHLIEFATTLPDEYDQVYIGGYPATSASTINYVFESLAIEGYQGFKDRESYFSFSNKLQEGGDINHFVDDTRLKASVANGYVMQEVTSTGLEGGSSGAMVVIAENEKIKVLGIWWGYWEDEVVHTVYGAIEPFVNYKNVDPWILSVPREELAVNWFDYDFGDLYAWWN